MRIGWRSFLKQKFRKKSAYHALGIAVSLDSVTFCALRKHNGETLLALEETVSFSQWGAQLAKWVVKHGLAGTPTYVAFSIHWYQILQVDRPAVEASEMNAALTWSVKELLGSDKDMVIDYTDLPVPLAGNAKINIFALPKEDVQQVCEAVFAAGLTMQLITAEELATSELVPRQSEAVLTIVQEAGEEICLNIIKDGQLYFSRRLKGFENLGSFSEDELRMGIGESLSVQIQRSMDFYESQLRQAPIRQIMMRLDTPHREALSQQIEQVVSAKVSYLVPSVGIELPGMPPERVNYSSLGAALNADTPVQVNGDAA
ncbi:hypothetical protein [Alteromonas lipolytica]|uniref:MSHA biogenesis protein MshI n=1 Tax=Alteromonas lipolytica TaxID=1856405 RepID=A0A1E8F8J0_9ALTE|nr:hypothetical protein [Alteromonas lipolytica]OFI32232.1 hypothetical protein BFC17_08420 [Alteromonas lipolytica]GGF82794.1 MSHA biogenesis protein MshI1 [Alteromonas lipolytica]